MLKEEIHTYYEQFLYTTNFISFLLIMRIHIDGRQHFELILGENV